MKKTGAIILILIAAARLSWASEIKGAAKPKIIYGWCGKEIHDYCQEAKTMPERLRCLEAHKNRLSTDCRKKVKAAHQKAAQLLHACSHDLSKYCASQMSGYGPASQCLLNNQKKLSSSCREQMPQIQHYAYRTLVFNFCKPQILGLCYQETTEKGVSRCLKDNLAQLPFGCQQAGLKAGLWTKSNLASVSPSTHSSQNQGIQALEP